MITEVLYVPTMKNNLLSIGQLLQKGFSMNLYDGTMEIFDRMQKKILKVKISENRTFQVKLGAFDSQCLNAETKSDESWLWHMRYGHLNFKDLNLTHAKDIVTGLPQVRIPKFVCDHCMINKQTRTSFSNYTQIEAENNRNNIK